MHIISNGFNGRHIKLNLPKAPTEQLYDAISEDNLEKTKKLLRNYEVDPNYINCLNYTPLMIAILKINRANDFVQVLLENNADPNLKVNGIISPIYLAMWLNKVDILEMLIMHGAVLDFNVKDRYGLNLVDKARQLGHNKMENILLKYFELHQRQKNDLLDCILSQFKQSFNHIKPYQYYLAGFSSTSKLSQRRKNQFIQSALYSNEAECLKNSSNDYRLDVLVSLLKNKYCIT